MPKVESYKKFLSSIPFVILGLLLFRDRFPLGSYSSYFGCGGEIFWILIFLFYISLLFLEYVVASYNYIRYKRSVNPIPLYTTVLLWGLFYGMNLIYPDPILGKVTLQAQLKRSSAYPELTLKLRQNKKYELTYYHWHNRATIRETYQIYKDTLSLQENDMWRNYCTEVQSRYLIDSNKGFLYPINTAGLVEDSTRWLHINRYSNE